MSLVSQKEREVMLKVQAMRDQSDHDLMILLSELGRAEDRLIDFLNNPGNSQVSPSIKLEFLRLHRAIRKVRNTI